MKKITFELPNNWYDELAYLQHKEGFDYLTTSDYAKKVILDLLFDLMDDEAECG